MTMDNLKEIRGFLEEMELLYSDLHSLIIGYLKFPLYSILEERTCTAGDIVYFFHPFTELLQACFSNTRDIHQITLCTLDKLVRQTSNRIPDFCRALCCSNNLYYLLTRNRIVVYDLSLEFHYSFQLQSEMPENDTKYMAVDRDGIYLISDWQEFFLVYSLDGKLKHEDHSHFKEPRSISAGEFYVYIIDWPQARYLFLYDKKQKTTRIKSSLDCDYPNHVHYYDNLLYFAYDRQIYLYDSLTWEKIQVISGFGENIIELFAHKNQLFVLTGVTSSTNRLFTFQHSNHSSVFLILQKSKRKRDQENKEYSTKVKKVDHL